MNNYGLNDDFRYIEIELDSLDAQLTFSNPYTPLNWPLFYFNRPFVNIAAFKILEAQVPFTYYVVNPTNDTFILQENGSMNTTITLPSGNYNPNQMAITLATYLSTESPNDWVYVVNYSAATNNFAITNTSGGPTGNFSFIFGTSTDTGNTNPRLLLGFGSGTTSSFLSNTSQIITSGAISLFGADYMYLNSTIMGPLVQLYLPQGAINLANGDIGPQVCKMTVNDAPNETIYYTDPDPQKWFNMENLFNLSSVDFYFTLGNTNQVVDFNGQNFSLKVGILIRNSNQNNFQSATYAQGRVQSRVTPR